MNILKKLLTLIILVVLIFICVFVYENIIPLKIIDGVNNFISSNRPIKFGTTVTTINGSDTLSSSRSVINNNFTALNNGKIENSSSSIAAITTLLNLTSVGTITTGTWNATNIAINKWGTGTSSPSQYQVILGNGSYGLTIASSTGTLNQVLTSNGAGAYPSWKTYAIDQSGNYTWTGLHVFTATSTFDAASTTKLMINGSQKYNSNYTAGSTTLAQSLVRATTNSTSYIKIKDIRVGGNGTIRVSFDISTNDTNAYARIYVNDVAVGTERTSATSALKKYNEDISGIKSGDHIQIWGKNTTGGGSDVYVDNYMLYVGSVDGSEIILE